MKSRWRGLWPVTHGWGVIALAMVMRVLWPMTILLAVDEPDPLRQARTTHAGWLERALLAPYWVSHHPEHHHFTQMSCWHLPRAHALLRRSGTTMRMEVQPSYAAVMRLAASR